MAFQLDLNIEKVCIRTDLVCGKSVIESIRVNTDDPRVARDIATERWLVKWQHVRLDLRGIDPPFSSRTVNDCILEGFIDEERFRALVHERGWDSFPTVTREEAIKLTHGSDFRSWAYKLKGTHHHLRGAKVVVRKEKE